MAQRAVQWRVLVALAVLPAACSRSKPETEPTPEKANASADAMVRVENRGFSDMTIYLLHGSQRIRLGVVNGNSTAAFTIRNQYTMGGPVRFLADPIGSSRTPVSEELVVNPGDVVTLMIPPN